MYCLDTYALWEIQFANEKFSQFLLDNFVVADWTLAEFYRGLLKTYNEETAEYWLKKLRPSCRKVDIDMIIKAAKFQYENKKTNMTMYDAVSYIYAQENDLLFVTGDKEFKGRKGVMFIQK